VEVVQVSRRFGKVSALEEVSLAIRPGEFFALLGPSGCGKTTLLRIVAGLDLPDAGTVRISGEEVLDVPAHKRPVNTVFQSYALFPHLRVYDNVAFGLRMKKLGEAEIRNRVQRILETVRIAELGDRRPAQLSGGQKQRVALARAIVNEPQVLLLDEPLGALDLKLRKELQIELHALQRRLGMTFIYVTHDQDEALVMSDRIAVMNAGRIEQIGSSIQIYEHPRNRFVAQFLGSCNLIEAESLEQEPAPNMVRALTPLGPMRIDMDEQERSLVRKSACLLAIRPEKVRLLQAPDPNLSNLANCFPATVRDLAYTGSETLYQLETAGGPINARVLNHQTGSPALAAGGHAFLHFPPEALIVLESGGS
jgi:spermidine/putrescine transport system ATP-binding protein